jgi:predicted PurR-regulated permease PerM
VLGVFVAFNPLGSVLGLTALVVVGFVSRRCAFRAERAPNLRARRSSAVRRLPVLRPPQVPRRPAGRFSRSTATTHEHARGELWRVAERLAGIGWNVFSPSSAYSRCSAVPLFLVLTVVFFSTTFGLTATFIPAVPRRHQATPSNILRKLDLSVGDIRGSCSSRCVVGLAISLGMAVLGVPFAL